MYGRQPEESCSVPVSNIINEGEKIKGFAAVLIERLDMHHHQQPPRIMSLIFHTVLSFLSTVRQCVLSSARRNS